MIDKLELTDENGVTLTLQFDADNPLPLFFTLSHQDDGTHLLHLNIDQVEDLASWFQKVDLRINASRT